MRKKTIFITGASSGFGKLAAAELLGRGHTIIAAVRGGEARLRGIFDAEHLASGRLHAIDLDLEQPEASVARASSLVRDRFGGKLDVLVNNAGYGLFGPLEEITTAQLRHQFEVNFFSPILLARELLPFLRRQQGRIVNVSSVAGLMTFPLYGPYSATKHALEAMTEALHYELKPLGVQVAMIEPGGFRTDFNRRGGVFATPANANSSYAARIAALRRVVDHFSPRQGDPRRVGRLLVRLCERDRIPLRTVIGIDASFMTLLKRCVPDSWRVSFVDFLFRKSVFKD